MVISYRPRSSKGRSIHYFQDLNWSLCFKLGAILRLSCRVIIEHFESLWVEFGSRTLRRRYRGTEHALTIATSDSAYINAVAPGPIHMGLTCWALLVVLSLGQWLESRLYFSYLCVRCLRPQSNRCVTKLVNRPFQSSWLFWSLRSPLRSLLATAHNPFL